MRGRAPELVATCLLLFAVSGTVVAKSLQIQSFDASIEVDANGEVRVEERIEVAFRGCWNGIFRDITESYTYPSGVRGTIRLFVDAVEDGNAKALEHWETKIPMLNAQNMPVLAAVRSSNDPTTRSPQRRASTN